METVKIYKNGQDGNALNIKSTSVDVYENLWEAQEDIEEYYYQEDYENIHTTVTDYYPDSTTAQIKTINGIEWIYYNYFKLCTVATDEDGEEESVEAIVAIKNYVFDEGEMIYFDSAVELMDDELREEIYREYAPCKNQDFFELYCEAHEKKFGERFEAL